jgi:hypothetical protein
VPRPFQNSEHALLMEYFGEVGGETRVRPCHLGAKSTTCDALPALSASVARVLANEFTRRASESFPASARSPPRRARRPRPARRG